MIQIYYELLFVVLTIIAFDYDNIVLTKVIASKQSDNQLDHLNHFIGGKTKK